ncbi:Cytochrome P450 4g15, partial [Temnothorax longispinosus]
PKWRAHRKLIAPTFHLNVLKSFIDLFNANSRAVVERMRKEGDKEFDCHDYMSECTVEILLETAMGVSKSTQDRSGFEYAMAVMKQDVRHSPPASHEGLAQAGLAVQSHKIRERSDPFIGDHSWAHEEGHCAQEAGVQEWQAQYN